MRGTGTNNRLQIVTDSAIVNGVPDRIALFSRTVAVGYIPNSNLRFVGASTPATQPANGINGGSRVTTGGVNLREGAGTGHNTIRLLPRGTRLTLLSTSGSWMRVRVGNDEGWVSSQFVATLGQGQTTGSVNLRQGAGASHSVIRTLSRGTSVTVLEQTNNWARVIAGNDTGWISTQFLNLNLTPTGNRMIRASVNFRSGAGVNHGVIRNLRNGTVVNVLGQSGNWVRVSQNGQEGYVSAQFIGGVLTFPTNGRRAITTPATLNMRSGAGTNHDVIRTFSRGTRLTLLSTSGSWMRVRTGSYEGWVNAQFVATLGQGQTTGSVNLRQGAGSAHQRIRTLASGTNVTILEQRAGWARVRAGNDTGWISTRFLRISGVPTGNRLTRASVNFRSGPGTGHKSIRTIPSGATVNVLSQTGNWLRVNHNGRVGYISAQFVAR